MQDTDDRALHEARAAIVQHAENLRAQGKEEDDELMRTLKAELATIEAQRDQPA